METRRCHGDLAVGLASSVIPVVGPVSSGQDPGQAPEPTSPQNIILLPYGVSIRGF